MDKQIWRLVLLMSITALLIGCTVSEQQRRNETNTSDALNQFANRFALEMGGYDSNCVESVAQMRQEGRLSPGETQYLINQKCKKQQQQQLQQKPDCTKCPVCGVGGLMAGFRGAVMHYRCVMGHVWPCGH